MTDLQDYTVSPQGGGQARTWRISCRVIGDDGTVLRDLTGGNALLFPKAFLDLSDALQEEFMNRNAYWLIAKNAGLPV
jgi:hypothetical protein